ncbi:chorismate lyase [bacterium SCSIO 12696]|nr:chorismate lyase [bacterium SCSIO 12696]
MFHREPAWRSYRRVPRHSIPQSLRHWLLDQGSLTERLIAASGTRFQVQVLNQRWQLPRLSECRLLGLPSRHHALVREVILHGADQPWVYARSVLPMATLTGRLRAMRQLDNRPLGALLFSDPTMERSPMEIACLTTDNAVVPTQLGKLNHPVWGRRSVFQLDNKPLMVSEIFLPGFPGYKPGYGYGVEYQTEFENE